MEKDKPKDETKDMAEPEQTPKTYTLSFTEDELIEQVRRLDQDEDVLAFLKVQNGAKKYGEYIKLVGLLNKDR